MGGRCRGRASRESFPTPLKSLNSFRAYLCRSSSSDEHRPGNYADEYTRARKAVGARDQAYVDVSGLGCLLEEMRGCSSVPLRCVAEHGDDKGDAGFNLFHFLNFAKWSNVREKRTLFKIFSPIYLPLFGFAFLTFGNC